MLAADEITLRIGKETVYLRPSLRAAMRLERRFGGFDRIIANLLDDNATTFAAVIRESATTTTDVPRLIEGFVDMPLHLGIEALRGPLIDHVLRLAGRDGTEDETDDPNVKRVTYAEHHARLFAIGTGWLGWTPETTYSATAAEIKAAFAGRVDMLKAIFGGGENADPPPSDEEFNAKVLAFTQAMGTRKVAA